MVLEIFFFSFIFDASLLKDKKMPFLREFES